MVRAARIAAAIGTLTGLGLVAFGIALSDWESPVRLVIAGSLMTICNALLLVGLATARS